MITVKNALEQINAERFWPVYLLMGSEAYLRERLFKTLTEKFLGEEGKNAGLSKVEGKPEALQKAMADLNMPVLFSAGRRIVLIDDPVYLKAVKSKDKETQEKEKEKEKEKAKEAEKATTEAEKTGGKKKKAGTRGKKSNEIDVPELVKDFWEKNRRDTENIIVFRVSEGNKNRSLFKLLDKKLQAAVDCSPLQSDMLRRWIENKAMKTGLTIEPGGIEKLIMSTEGNMYRLENEIEKIACYLGDDREAISGELVEKLVFGNPQANIFRLVDALGGGRPNQAWRELQGLYMLNEHPLLILKMVTRQYRLILEMISVREKGSSPGEAAARLKLPPFVVNKLARQAGLYQKKDLRNIFAILLQTDYEMKRGISDQHLALELLIRRLSGARRQ